MIEIWKDVPGYEGFYQASTLGNVRSLNFGRVRLLKAFLTNRGYYNIVLSKNTNKKLFYIHQLIAITFLDHIPDGHKFVIDHINSDQLDNRISNLRIVTNRENCSKEKTIKKGLPVGVSFYKRNSNYKATIRIDGIQKHLGYFNTVEEASETYQKALSMI